MVEILQQLISPSLLRGVTNFQVDRGEESAGYLGKVSSFFAQLNHVTVNSTVRFVSLSTFENAPTLHLEFFLLRLLHSYISYEISQDCKSRFFGNRPELVTSNARSNNSSARSNNSSDWAVFEVCSSNGFGKTVESQSVLVNGVSVVQTNFFGDCYGQNLHDE